MILAFREGQWGILEPIMNVEVNVPLEFQQTVMAELNTRQALFKGTEMRDDYITIFCEVNIEFRENPKSSNTKKCCDYLKNGAVSFCYRVMDPNDADRMANGVDPGAVWSGCTRLCVFFILQLYEYQLICGNSKFEVQEVFWCKNMLVFVYWDVQLCKRSKSLIFEPHHDQTCLCHMRTTKAQISLRICAVWSVPLLFTA